MHLAAEFPHQQNQIVFGTLHLVTGDASLLRPVDDGVDELLKGFEIVVGEIHGVVISGCGILEKRSALRFAAVLSHAMISDRCGGEPRDFVLVVGVVGVV